MGFDLHYPLSYCYSKMFPNTSCPVILYIINLCELCLILLYPQDISCLMPWIKLTITWDFSWPHFYTSLFQVYTTNRTVTIDVDVNIIYIYHICICMYTYMIYLCTHIHIMKIYEVIFKTRRKTWNNFLNANGSLFLAVLIVEH